MYAWREYYTYGGIPLVLSKMTHKEKSKYLKDLFTKTYISDVLEHNKILNEQAVLEDLLNIVSSSVGSLTIEDEAKRKQETNSLNRISDSFRKIIVVKDNIIPWYDEHGILYIGIEQFLLDEHAIDI